jgi:hypothetical protein
MKYLALALAIIMTPAYSQKTEKQKWEKCIDIGTLAAGPIKDRQAGKHLEEAVARLEIMARTHGRGSIEYQMTRVYIINSYRLKQESTEAEREAAIKSQVRNAIETCRKIEAEK